jgi:hypothetical protein
VSSAGSSIRASRSGAFTPASFRTATISPGVASGAPEPQ